LTRRLVLLSLLLTLAVGSLTFLVTIKMSRAGTLVKTDGLAYFLYARSAVIDFDTDITNEFEELDARIPEGYDNMMVALRKHGKRHPQTGRIVVPWPVGSGLVMVPFYAVGWAVECMVAGLAGRSPDSYGLIPQFFYGTGSLLYGLLGFWCTFLICRRVPGALNTHLLRVPVAWVCPAVMICAGSAAFYIFISPSMAHAASFGLVALLTLLWWQRWDGETEGIALLGFLLGLLITIRYQNAMFFPLLVALVLREGQRHSFLQAAKQAAIGVAALVVPVLVQVLHYFTQHGFSHHGVGVRSSSFQLEQNEVSIVSTRFFDVLFSCLHGAVYWTPIVGIALVGLLLAARKTGWARVFALTFTVHVYLLGALADGTAGHTFGMRYLIETTPLLAAGLTFLLVESRGRLPMPVWGALLAALLAFNALLILAFGAGTISGTHCVTHGEMVRGILAALGRFSGLG
jgi:hypothetical protein